MKSILVALASLVLASNCTSSKSTTKGDSESNSQAAAKQLMDQGFMKGTIVYSEKENDCPYTIKVEADEPYFLDPINLDGAYKNDGEKIWFKFTGLRRMNRCEKANPVSITEMQKRGE